MTPGDRLREFRESLKLTLRDVELATLKIADVCGNPDFVIPASRLSDIEIHAVIPNIFRLYSLSVVYRVDFVELLRYYGVDVDHAPAHESIIQIDTTHIVASQGAALRVQIPIALDPGFNPVQTANLTRMIEEWGHVPVARLGQLPRSEYLYGYIGLQDWTMWPLLQPGAFVQVDTQKTTIQPGYWKSEYERPIYFLATRDGFVCCWCAVEGSSLILQSHPLSPVAARTLRNRHDAQVLGTVVGVAQRLGTEKAPYASSGETLHSTKAVR